MAQADSTSCFQKWTTGTKGIIVKVLVLLILAIIFFVIGYAVGYSIHRCKEECVTCPTIPYTTTVSPWMHRKQVLWCGESQHWVHSIMYIINQSMYCTWYYVIKNISESQKPLGKYSYWINFLIDFARNCNGSSSCVGVMMHRISTLWFFTLNVRISVLQRIITSYKFNIQTSL